jgi:hypothetical protein
VECVVAVQALFVKLCILYFHHGYVRHVILTNMHEYAFSMPEARLEMGSLAKIKCLA